MISDNVATTNMTVTFVDRPNSFMTDVTVSVTNTDGSTYKQTFEMLKPLADYIKSQNYTITQLVALFQRTTNGFHIP